MKNLLLTLSTLFAAFFAHAQQVTVGDIYPNDLETVAFTLPSEARVSIDGTGGVFRDDYKLLMFYGWILDASSREVVWHVYDHLKEHDLAREKGLYDFSDEITLPAGSYELYFTGGYDHRGWGDSWTISDFNDLIDEIFDTRYREKYRSSMREDLYVTVSAPGLKKASMEDFLAAKTDQAAIYFVKARDGETFKQGFTLNREATLQVYALGEGDRDEMYDYAYIYDVVGRKRVFEMSYRNTSHAGGADKNLKVDEEITLPKGSYMLAYHTDGSHSHEEWNALPPDDPQFWGVALFPESVKDREAFAENFNPPALARPVAEIVGVRNYETRSLGIRLSEEVKLNLLCIGERGHSDNMADYGWILDANTRQLVWKMKEYRTSHAGGASKNRMVEEDLTLPAGDYLLYYKTDGSHAFNSWNATRPYDPDRWGITLWAADERGRKAVSTFDPDAYRSQKVIAAISDVRDDDYLKDAFDIKRTTEVVIHAIGEGDDDKMYDYGWVRNMDTGRIVWEMDYRSTEHAGGARKNREIREKITLEPGEYRVYYRTDGSHSSEDWNDEPPSDPEFYGIQIFLAE
ncbi:hypothetical protein [Marinoscillum furvescens]|uniref:Uncharacterized protein n=1 Tax=Marinoscillum furvescens DSM 4134 TaxID=1122208 RepID=A0A3D9L7F1_MARFU|nr:hypothetical protein [Marinoscillum furvescens]REE01041.1 hypothetical protein C7460_10460 [Marinoscillum furvescens DSM 4134]